MNKKILIIFFWLLSLILTSIYTYENPEKIEIFKNYFLKDGTNVVGSQDGDILRSPGNSFAIEFSKKISITEKTAFIVHKNNSKFNEKHLEIYFQNGYLYKNSELKKINLPSSFTEARNGGLKGLFIYKNNKFGFSSSLDNDCFYASIFKFDDGKEIFKTKCLPKSKIDFNGLGSSHIHYDNKILLTIGTPEQESSVIRSLAQDSKSMYGKIIEINKNDLDKIINGDLTNIQAQIFTSGHRNPQGITKIDQSLFSVEHGPKGGDELNKIIKNENYGWPKVSYGTQYIYDQDGKSYEINHEKNKFKEPLFAFVPSVGISAVNNCPKSLTNYYKKPCLLALSLYGNSLRRGRSIIIFLLNEKLNKVHSVEKIHLRDNLKLRHFVTNSRNELFEDEDGNIYVSADKVGIYKLRFDYFRN